MTFITHTNTSKSRSNILITSKALFNAFSYIYISFTLGLNAVILVPLNATGQSEGSPIHQLSWLLMHLLAGVFFLKFNRHSRSALYFLLGFGAYVVCSVFLTSDPLTNIVYAFMLFGNAVFAYTYAGTFDYEHFKTALTRVLLVLIIAGIFFYFAGYSQVFYFDPHDRSSFLGIPPARGFFPHKIMGSLYAVLALILLLRKPAFSAKWLGGVAAILLFILLTGSSTGLALTISIPFVGLFAWIIIHSKLSPGSAAALTLFGAAIVAFVITILMGDVLALLDRDPTLTGRTTLWAWGIEAWTSRPFFGWGFLGYFQTDEANQARVAIGSFRNYDVPHFHQSFIQTLVDFGVVGLGMLLVCIYTAFAFLQKTQDVAGLTILLVSTIASMTMFLFFNYNHAITTWLFITFFIALRYDTLSSREISTL